MHPMKRALAGGALVLAFGAASAGPKPQPQPTLAVQGNVMVSTDAGSFVSATNGQAVGVGQSLLVTAGSVATVTHPGGQVAQYASGVHAIAAPVPPPSLVSKIRIPKQGKTKFPKMRIMTELWLPVGWVTTSAFLLENYAIRKADFTACAGGFVVQPDGTCPSLSN